MLIHDFSLRISSEFALVYSVMEPLLLRHCTTSREEVLASEIGDAGIFTLLPCKSQRVLVTAGLGTAIGEDLITAILDSAQGVSIMLIQKNSTFINCSHFLTEPNADTGGSGEGGFLICRCKYKFLECFRITKHCSKK